MNLKCSVTDIMRFTPWDNRYNLVGSGRNIEQMIDLFYKNFFIKLEEFEAEKKFLEERISPYNDKFKHINVISGYSGNGKSTFINWFKSYIEEDKHSSFHSETIINDKKPGFFKIINLIEFAHGLDQTKDLIKKSIISDLIELLKKSKSIPLIINNKEIFYDYFKNDSWNYVVNYYQREICKETNIPFDIKFSSDFISQLSLQQTLILYFLEYIYIFKERDFSSQTFCFDNLDELEYEYMTKEIWYEFLNIASVLHSICQNSSLSINFDFAREVSFVIIFREANLAIRNAQLNERISAVVNERRFLFTKSVKKIIQNRLAYVDNSSNIISTSQNLKDLINIVANEPHTDAVFLPLFNFDYRRFAEAIIDIAIGDYPSYPNLVNITKEEYSNIQGECINIGRGILFFAFLKFFEKNGLLLNFNKPNEDKNKENGYCRPSRLLLTALCNMSYSNGFTENIQDFSKEKPKEIGMLHIYKEIEKIITPKKYIDWIIKFFNFHKSSWAHLITIYNKELDAKKEINLDDELNLLLKYKNSNSSTESNSITEEEIKKLNKIEISTNPSAYIYIRYLIVHFEYFSIYATQVNDTRKYKPLLQELDFDNSNLLYSFEDVIESVLNVVKDYKKNTEIYFKKNVETKYSISDYSQSIFTFRKEHEQTKQFYFSRIVTTHIEYLENFRYYLWHDSNIRNRIEENHTKFPASKSFKQIQFFIVKKISEYLDLLKDFPYPALGNIIPSLENAIYRNVQTEIKAGKWYKIEVREREDWEKELAKKRT